MPDTPGNASQASRAELFTVRPENSSDVFHLLALELNPFCDLLPDGNGACHQASRPGKSLTNIILRSSPIFDLRAELHDARSVAMTIRCDFAAHSFSAQAPFRPPPVLVVRLRTSTPQQYLEHE